MLERLEATGYGASGGERIVYRLPYPAPDGTTALSLIDLGVSLAVLRLRQRDGLPEAGEFRLPFGPIIPLLSCLIVGWLLLQVPAEEAVSIAGLISASLIVYGVRKRVRSRVGG